MKIHDLPQDKYKKGDKSMKNQKPELPRPRPTPKQGGCGCGGKGK
jgi:hypothetical protein